jgi:hypothetical protein
MNNLLCAAMATLMLLATRSNAQDAPSSRTAPELAYGVVADFFHMPNGMTQGEASGFALNSKGHIFSSSAQSPC